MTSGTRTFFSRLCSTLVLWTLILCGVFSGNEVTFFVLVAGLALLGLWEYFRMLDAGGIPNFQLTAIITAAVFLIGGFYYYRGVGPNVSYGFEVGTLVMFVFVVFARQMFARIQASEPLQRMAYTLFGLVYIPWLFHFITKIIYTAPRLPDGATTGQFYVLYLLAVTKFSDMGAYTFGSLFGKHRLVPHISPKKTWEGLGGALFSALLASYWMYALMPNSLSAMTFWDATVLGLLLGFAAVVGDLAESIVKRSTQAKDSSHLLPGIGGVMDLIDSLLFTAPLLFFYMRLVLKLP